MGKKKAEVMAKEKSGFMAGAARTGVDEKVADEVFELMAFFAGYGFNRSHSAAYAIVTYQTAYLKHHYPHEFMAGLLSCDRDNIDNIVKFTAEARAMGLTVERPDVNESDLDFTVVPAPPSDGAEKVDRPEKKKGGKKGGANATLTSKVIRFGLGAVKGVGEGAVESAIAARKEGGPFESVYDFCGRADLLKVNRRVLEAFVKSGAFDSIGKKKGVSRAQMFAALDAAMERAAQAQRDRRSGQTSLFGLFEVAAPRGASPSGGSAGWGATAELEVYPPIDEWNPKQLLAFEKESLGFYISGHPLDRYQGDISRYASATTSDLAKHARPAGPPGPRRDDEPEVSVGGIVSEYRERPTKSGTGRMAFFFLQDQYGQVEVIVFPKTYEKVRDVLTSDEPLLCTGRVVDEGEGEQKELRFHLTDAMPLARAREQKTTRFHIMLNADMVAPNQIDDLKGILASHRGKCATYLHLRIPLHRTETVIPLGESYAVTPTDDLLVRIERLFGDRAAIFR
jgi:DNA polymerase-3 subunit alpha